MLPLLEASHVWCNWSLFFLDHGPVCRFASCVEVSQCEFSVNTVLVHQRMLFALLQMLLHWHRFKSFAQESSVVSDHSIHPTWTIEFGQGTLCATQKQSGHISTFSAIGVGSVRSTVSVSALQAESTNNFECRTWIQLNEAQVKVPREREGRL